MGVPRAAAVLLVAVVAGSSAAACAGPHPSEEPVHLNGSFQLTDGRVVCDIDAGSAGCEMHRPTLWKVPPKPSGCHDDWLGGVELTHPRPARFGCWSGAPGLGVPSIPEVKTGRVVVDGPMRCSVRRDGVRCEDTSTGHGFVYTRAAYRLY
ncbi:MAG TPA: hypothetical protein VFH66_06100 [Mycobacteriales bacterium]|nr:hypothetical protein [Mycobacteriales bacterium]